MIVRICNVLPCPDCSRDASQFLAKTRVSDYKTKDDFKMMLYLFHNWVNAKKRKPLYNFSDLNKYASLDLMVVINDFISKYQTKGNMKLLADSFQRQFVIRDFIAWFKHHVRAFYTPIQPAVAKEPCPTIAEEQTVSKESTQTIAEEQTVSEEPYPTIAEEQTTSEEPYPIIAEEKTVSDESSPTITEEKTVSDEPSQIKTSQKKKRSNKSKK